ncbi:MAG: putative quinol monooxygenase [Amaricoccus sp.]
MPYVRVAELEIDPARLAEYQAAVREEIEQSVRVEPGVLAIHAVAEKEAPTRLRFLEIYADEAAYLSHLASPHFRKYAAATEGMIRSKRLMDAVEVALCAKR